MSSEERYQRDIALARKYLLANGFSIAGGVVFLLLTFVAASFGWLYILIPLALNMLLIIKMLALERNLKKVFADNSAPYVFQLSRPYTYDELVEIVSAAGESCYKVAEDLTICCSAQKEGMADIRIMLAHRDTASENDIENDAEKFTAVTGRGRLETVYICCSVVEQAEKVEEDLCRNAGISMLQPVSVMNIIRMAVSGNELIVQPLPHCNAIRPYKLAVTLMRTL